MHYKTYEICGLRSGRSVAEKRIFIAKFPLDEERCKQWVKATGKEDLVYVPIEKLHQLKYICKKHFRSKDDKLKKDICFGETLILSCGHVEGDVEDASSESAWTCKESTTSESSSHVSVMKEHELPPAVEDDTKVEEEEINDFHFYFFPDCKKPIPPRDSKDSILIVDGLPQINLASKPPPVCTCVKNELGECECFVKIPCYCGAKVKESCTCDTLEKICICKPFEPNPVCVCPEDAEVCTCIPGIIQPECTCDKVEKPCICPRGTFKFPSVICTCNVKSTPSTPSSRTSLRSHGEGEAHGEKSTKSKLSAKSKLSTKSKLLSEKSKLSTKSKLISEKSKLSAKSKLESESESKSKSESEKKPCECQKPDVKKLCYCTKDKECICDNTLCTCGLQRTCTCEPTEDENIPCKDEPMENKSICSCDIPPVCTCGRTAIECTCFPVQTCTCGDADNCKCFAVCDCKDPCICDTEPVITKACICVDSTKVPVTELVCTCPKKEDNKLRKVRAGKHGYRWCHEVDPHHTYFDFAYDRFDKVEKKPSGPVPVVIQGLNDEPEKEEECPIHEIKAPKYEKKIRRPSLDCCSAVGGMSINVEALGEDKDKLLVQVVMHSSKEGAKTGSKLVSILDCNLHTMEENRTEFITKRALTKERRSYMAICDTGYYNKITRICGDKYVVKRVYHTFEEAHDFLLEGSNIVLLRYLALTRFRGKVKTDTVMMDGHVCQSIYVSHGVNQAIVNGTPMFVVKVERHIIEPSGFVHQTLTVLTLRGHTVSHEWADSSYILHLNPLLKIVPEKDEIEEHAPLRSKWREDLQLLSDYLDFKTIRTSEGGRYMTESGTLTGVVRDYLQAILLLRPQDAMHFTRHYFGSVLSALDLPHDEYFDPATRHVRYYFFED